MSRESVVRTVDLWKVYGDEVKVEALKSVDIDIGSGEFVSITGPSGSGKSTLLNMIGGLDRPTRGDVYIDGTDISTLSDRGLARLRNRSLGFIFQFHNLLPEFTATENAMVPQLLAGTGKREARERAVELLETVGLGHRLDHRPAELSGGQNQRVAIARALSNNPSIVIGDEPTGNNDTETSDKLYDLFRRLNREIEQTFIVVTHDLDLAARADRTIRLVDGRVDS